jgi:hypothetical protein
MAEGASGDDFAPLRGQGAGFLELLGGGELASRRSASCAGVRTPMMVGPFMLRLREQTWRGKAVQ